MLGGADGELGRLYYLQEESSLPGTAVIDLFRPFWSWREDSASEYVVFVQDKWNALLFIYYL